MPPLLLRKIGLSLAALVLLLCELPLSAHADPQFTEDFQTWQIGAVHGHITKRFMGYLDTQNNEINLTDKRGNSFNNNTHQGQLLVRAALGFQLTKTISLWSGYGWAPSFQPHFRNENQVWEQVLYERRFKHVNLSNRTRLEMRYIADTSGTAVRLRNQFRVAFPLGKTRWSLVAYDEPFFNLNTVMNGPRQGFNQNWAFIGIGRQLSNTVNLDVGYLNNYVRNFRPVPDRINNVIFVSLNCNLGNSGFGLRKPKAAEPGKNLPASSTLKSTHTLAPGNATDALLQAAGAQADVPSLLPVAQPNLEIAPVAMAATASSASMPATLGKENTKALRLIPSP
jgi:hypothetical protein